MLTDNSLVLKKTIFGSAIGWTVFIAVLCLMKFSKLPSFGVSGADKYVHFTFHFVFTLLWSSYLLKVQKSIIIKTLFKILLVSVVYGVLIELLQGEFTTTRKADILDVLANTTGATFAVIALLCYKRFNKNKS